MQNALPVKLKSGDEEVFNEEQMKSRLFYISLNALFQTPPAKLPEKISEKVRKEYFSILQTSSRLPYEHFDEYKVRQSFAKKLLKKKMRNGHLFHRSVIQHGNEKMVIDGTYIKEQNNKTEQVDGDVSN